MNKGNDMYTISQGTPNSYGEVRWLVRNEKGFVVHSEWTEELAVAAVARKIETGDFYRQLTDEEKQAYIKSFAARLEEDAKHGYTRD